MRSRPAFRFSFMLTLLALAGLGVTQLASANPPSAAGPFPLASVPDCIATAPDTSGAHICQLHQTSPSTPWQAATGEWIVIRNPSGSASQATCLATQASVVATFTLDGDPIPVEVTPCAETAGLWWVEWRALSHPLPPGDHAVAMSRYYTTAVGGFPAGASLTFRETLTVLPRG
jgi:hypothetical protein